MKFLDNKEVNTGRQFEFDLAKAICILGMVFVHCFEELPLSDALYSSPTYYIFVIILDAIFGAGTFMTCMGVGIAYSRNNDPKSLMKRGLSIFILGHILNIVRYVLPYSLGFFGIEQEYYLGLAKYVIGLFLCNDIMQFAGLALILFGFLKKIKAHDLVILGVALIMSITGSFVRAINFESGHMVQFLGNFFGTNLINSEYEACSSFPLLNWFIFVVFGYFLGKFLRRCNNLDKYYAISTPISAAVILVYLLITIPNGLGMMSGEIVDYYQMTTPEALVIMCGAIFATGIYHFVSKLLNDKAKVFITGLSVNINKTYCIHWFIIGWLGFILWDVVELEEGVPVWMVFVIGIIVYFISTFAAELARKIQVKKRLKKNGLNSENSNIDYQ